jgi:hypothetical protein
MVCIRLKQWLHSISVACGTYVIALVCIYYIRTRYSYLFILRYFRQALRYYVIVKSLERKNIYFTARFIISDVVMSRDLLDITTYAFYKKAGGYINKPNELN